MSKHDNQTKTEDAASMHAYERSRRDADCGVSQEAQKGQGAYPCNTAPPKYNSLEVVNLGIDSLYLSYSGSLPITRCRQLELLKTQAQSYDPTDQGNARVELGGMTFRVFKHGRSPHAYLLGNNLFSIRVASSTANSVPVAYVEISSELLNLNGVESALAISDSLVAELVGEACFSKVSRADIFVDFVSRVDWNAVDNEQWACRSSRKGDYYDTQQLTGSTFGQGGDLSARLYNKTIEIESSKKAFFRDIWLANGWDSSSPVWRLEFQLRTIPLREFGISEPISLLEQLNGIWRYCTEKWLTLRTNNGDVNRSRWPLADIWQAIIEVDIGAQKQRPLRRVKVETTPTRDWLVIYLLGGLTSYMAANGHSDIEHAFNRFIHDADEYFTEHKRYGFSRVNEYVEARVAEKSTRFCMSNVTKE